MKSLKFMKVNISFTVYESAALDNFNQIKKYLFK